MRSYWNRQGPWPNVIGIFIKRGNLDKYTGRMPRKYWVLLPQAKEIPEVRRVAQNRPFPSTFQETTARLTPWFLTSDLQNWERMHFCGGSRSTCCRVSQETHTLFPMVPWCLELHSHWCDFWHQWSLGPGGWLGRSASPALPHACAPRASKGQLPKERPKCCRQRKGGGQTQKMSAIDERIRGKRRRLFQLGLLFAWIIIISLSWCLTYAHSSVMCTTLSSVKPSSGPSGGTENRPAPMPCPAPWLGTLQ